MQHILGVRADRPVKVSAPAVATLGLAFLALLAPVSGAEYPAARVGVLLGMAACVEALHAA
jgi:hypothetical protein